MVENALRKNKTQKKKPASMVNRLEEIRGYRFSNEQADTLEAIIANLIVTADHCKHIEQFLVDAGEQSP